MGLVLARRARLAAEAEAAAAVKVRPCCGIECEFLAPSYSFGRRVTQRCHPSSTGFTHSRNLEDNGSQNLPVYCMLEFSDLAGFKLVPGGMCLQGQRIQCEIMHLSRWRRLARAWLSTPWSARAL